MESSGQEHHVDDRVREPRSVSRREFLKIAGIAGAAAGAAGGLSALLAACGAATTTSASPTTAGKASTSAPAAATTATSAGSETAREIKIGFVDSLTGGLALFGIPGQWCLERWREATTKGVVCGDGKNHPVTFSVQDSQSDTNRASQVAGDLITNHKVDIIMAAASPDTVNPVADQAEALGTPMVSTDAPMEPYFFGRNGKADVGFKWTYHLFWGMDQISADSVDFWGQITTNKKVGVLWPNDVDGNAYRDYYPKIIENAGYTWIDGGSFQEPTEDFTFAISAFKKAGCDIVSAVQIPPDLAVFWKQCKQQRFTPKIFESIKASLFPSAIEALGKIGDGLVGPMWWHPKYPFKSSLTGETCQQLADDFEKRTKNQWTQPIMHYVCGEWAVDVLKRTKNVDDKQEIIKNVSTTKMADSVAGPFDFTQPVGSPKRKVPNVVVTNQYGGQWRLAASGAKHMFELTIVSNVSAPDIQVQDKLKPLPK